MAVGHLKANNEKNISNIQKLIDEFKILKILT